MKKLFPIFVLALVIPQIAMAAWWNPLSWFNNWSFFHNKSDATTQVLENRIKEFENKLSTSLATSTTSTSTTPKKSVPKDNSITTQAKNEVSAPIPTQSASEIPNIPSDWIKPGGGLYSAAEIVQNRKAKCAVQNMGWDGTMTGDAPNCISYDTLCSNKYPNTIFSKLDAAGVPSCDCKSGYAWNSGRTSCQVQQQNSYDNSDPYGVSTNSGINYTPEQLNAINCAYYGTNCTQKGTTINNYYQVTPAPAPMTTVINCANYQAEKNSLDNYYASHGTAFSGARVSADNALKAKYAECF